MNVAFLCAGFDRGAEPYVAADFLIRSIRRLMPRAKIVQCTDMDSPKVVGVDSVQRLPRQPLALWSATHYGALGDGDWLCTDTDVVIQKPVDHVFDDEFDLAVATREGTYLPGEIESEFMKSMPYNSGVVFTRKAHVWKEICASMPDDDATWYGIQKTIPALMATGRIRVKILDSTYNFPPRSADDEVSNKAIVHYKGPWRKKVLITRIYRETVCR